jgi:hypothetical protein
MNCIDYTVHGFRERLRCAARPSRRVLSYRLPECSSEIREHAPLCHTTAHESLALRFLATTPDDRCGVVWKSVVRAENSLKSGFIRWISLGDDHRCGFVSLVSVQFGRSRNLPFSGIASGALGSFRVRWRRLSEAGKIEVVKARTTDGGSPSSCRDLLLPILAS